MLTLRIGFLGLMKTFLQVRYAIDYRIDFVKRYQSGHVSGQGAAI
jgi:hypothetical protein